MKYNLNDTFFINVELKFYIFFINNDIFIVYEIKRIGIRD